MKRRNESKWIEILLDCIDKLMTLLRETTAKEQAEEIYREFFGT